MATHEPRRPYRSSYRQQQGVAQAGTTRQRIAAAARRRFAADGYAATRIEAIAREAGVAVPTVYANFASKRAILDLVAAAVDEDVDLAGADSAYLAAAGGRGRLRAGLAYVRIYMERYADIERIVRGAATAEPELVARWHYGDRARRHHAALAVAGLAAEGELRAGMSEREAVDVLHLLSNPDVFESLVVGSGWTPDEYGRWLLMTAEALLTTRAPHPVLDASEVPE